jgi:hypothetical protein
MDNSRTVALIFLFVIAFLFYLYNSHNADGSSKLSSVVNDITGGTAGKGTANKPLTSKSGYTSVLPNTGTSKTGGVTLPPGVLALPTIAGDNGQGMSGAANASNNPQSPAAAVPGFFSNGSPATVQNVPAITANTPGNLPGVNWTLGSNGYYTPPIAPNTNTLQNLLSILSV